MVKLAPNLPDPYHTLGLLYEAAGDPRKALDFYMIAAHMTPKVYSTPTSYAHSSPGSFTEGRNQGKENVAQSFKDAVSLSKPCQPCKQEVALWKRLAALSSEMGFIRQAIYCLSKVRPCDYARVLCLTSVSIMW